METSSCQYYFALCQSQRQYISLPVRPATVVVNGITVRNVSMIPIFFVKTFVPRVAKIKLKRSLKSTCLLPTCRNFLLKRICMVPNIIDSNGGLISSQSSTINTLPKRMASSSKYVNRSECCVVISKAISLEFKNFINQLTAHFVGSFSTGIGVEPKSVISIWKHKCNQFFPCGIEW